MSATQVRTISGFLLARFDEDEAVARAAREPLAGGYPDYRTYDDADTDAADRFLSHLDPARVLAEVEAKRQIVEISSPAVFDGVAELGGGLPDVLRLLASVYSDHPDYNPDWTP